MTNTNDINTRPTIPPRAPRRPLAVMLGLLTAVLPVSVRAQPAAQAQASSLPPAFHADAEVDPTAYVLGGHSVHVGLGWKRLRLDLGAYAMDVPKAVAGNDDFAVSFDGFGMKLQYFLFSEHEGGFVGVDAGVNRPFVARRGTDLAVRNTDVGVGVDFGWRFLFGGHFYATTWLGLGYTFGAEDVALGGSTFEAIRLTVFPAVHLGYRFR